MKREAGPGAGAFVVVLHSVHQAAGGAHDGQGSVALAVHLAQPTRLIARGHEQEVTACLDPVGEAILKTDVGAELVTPAGTHRREKLFRLPVTRAEQDHLQIPTQDVIERVRQHIKALLRCETPDQAEKGHIRAFR